MKKLAVITMLVAMVVATERAVLAQRLNLRARSSCPVESYPENPEEFLANFVIDLVNRNMKDDPAIVAEAAKLKTPEGLKELKEYLRKEVAIGDEDQKRYRFCSLLKDLAPALGEEDTLTIKQQLTEAIAESPRTTRRCLPFLCIFHLCKC
jgi:hypothetical protein